MIFFPMLFMAVLTIMVLFANLIARVRALRSRQVRVSYFRTFDGADVPPRILQLRNHLDNLFQLPVLFYTICLTNLALGIDNELNVTLAWIYCGARLTHTIIHTTYNHVLHRMLSFVASNIVLIVLWIRTAVLIT